MRNHRLCLLLLATLVFVAQAVLAQGFYYESVLKGGPFKEGSENLSKTYLMPKMMKHVNASDQDFLVLRLDKEKIISVDTKEKTYWEQTFAEMEKMMKATAAKMDEQMAQMQEQLKNLPEEQRKMMEGMFGKTMEKAGDVKMVKSGETKKISGFSCTKYEAKEADKVLMTMWTTKEVKGFDPLRKDYEALSRRMTAMNPGFMKGLIDAMFKVEGFPIETDWGGMTTTVTKVEQRSTPESEFAAPAGYKKVPMPMDEMPEGEKEVE